MMACSGGGGTTLGALELFYPVGGTSGTTTQHNNPCTAPAFTKNYSVIVVVTRTVGTDFSSYLQINNQVSTERGQINLSYTGYTNYISYAVFKDVKAGDVFKCTLSSGVSNTILFCIP